MNAVDLTRELIRLDTVAGGEQRAAELVAGPLAEAGYTIELYPAAPGRAGLVARRGSGERFITLSGHLDTVPLGGSRWRHDPHAGELDGDLLYGRGASDMKAGVSALVTAAERCPADTPVQVVLTWGEETGCEGAADLAARGALAPAAVLLIAEPTANRAVPGHKGALWLRATTYGVAAHGSMPQLGDNAIYKLARAVTAAEGFQFGTEPHPWMGAPTLNVGTIAGGAGINAVPDRAEATIDVRTVAGQDHASIRADLAGSLQVELEVLLDLPPVWTPPEDPWVARLVAAGEPARAATFFTDASVLRPALDDPPTVICGPGQPDQAHVTDEYCRVSLIEDAVQLYLSVLDAGGRGGLHRAHEEIRRLR
ncbi:M20 family metallopeptidase [Nonomuraea sp. NPDC059194]|uniref:M20 family metallopeptidase n=1 Tax=Nonomuraea sp. NPDC059194 TaxID=3346764 RepID=UPI0036950AC0